MTLLGRFLPKSLAGQLIGLILVALLGGHITAIVILADERKEALQASSRGEVLARTATIARLLAVSPSDLHPQLLENAQSPFVQFSISDHSATLSGPIGTREQIVIERLRRFLDIPNAEVRVRLGGGKKNRQNLDDDDDDDEHHRGAEKKRSGFFKNPEDSKRWRRHFRWGIQLSVQLENGQWLNSATRLPSRGSVWTLQPLLALGIAVLLIIGVVIVSVRRITRPLAQLATTADAVGRGESTSDIDEAGPEDIRRTVRAFNRMRKRLETFIEDRTNLLAAVSHDLRSPVTSLRLRAEFIEDEELKAKILETLIEMQSIIETTLTFAREETRTEETRPTDLAALIQSVVDDFADQNKPCTYSGPERFVLTVRPVSLKRAIRNLLDNAISYGGSAHIKLIPADPGEGDVHIIEIEDQGPGIPEADIERIFEPFVRLEASRNKETGGIGLGLAIARSIIKGHGGAIQAQNKQEGGLKVTISLPVAQ